jgi:sigma-E factor negative regulatory protein RseB
VRRLALVAATALVLGPLAVLAYVVAPDADHEPAAPPSRVPKAEPTVAPDARALLDRAAGATTTTAYRGVQFVSAWTPHTTSSEVVEVEHLPGRGTTVRTAGRPGTEARSMTMRPSDEASLVTGGAVGLLAAHYSLTVTGEGRVAGRAATVVAARRPGSAATRPDAARFWLDDATGLVLRREVYDGHGRTTRASAFVEIDVGGGAVTEGGGSRAWSRTIDQAGLATMRKAGWQCPARLPGPLSLVDARRGGDHGDIVHLSYGDGIASVSVFQQRGRLDEDGLAGHRRTLVAGEPVWVRGEVPRRVVWASGHTVYTVVADAPERTVDQVVAALPHHPAADGGTLGRLGRGLDRVASWFNPFS